eukprot:scaffold273942_cov23-Tisochrysis_lutea.AAC.2
MEMDCLCLLFSSDLTGSHLKHHAMKMCEQRQPLVFACFTRQPALPCQPQVRKHPDMPVLA